jgi:invasion protein IalB
VSWPSWRSDLGGLLMTRLKLSARIVGPRKAAVAVIAATTLWGPAPQLALAQQPAAPPAQKAFAPPPPGMPPLIYTQWTKVCRPNPATKKQVCSTFKQAATQEGVVIITAALVEAEGEGKVLQISVPMPVALRYGAGIAVDSNQATWKPYVTCVSYRCLAEFEGTADLIGKLKSGQTLELLAFAVGNSAFSLQSTPDLIGRLRTLVLPAVAPGDAAFSLQMPLSESGGNSFAKSNEGPGIDEKVFAEQQKNRRGKCDVMKSIDWCRF